MMTDLTNGGYRTRDHMDFVPIGKRGIPSDQNINPFNSNEAFLAFGGQFLTVRLMEVTPELAKEWLGTDTERQRGVKKANLDKIKRALKAGKWLVNGESIKFDTDGSLGDGQHRLSACVETGIPFVSLVVGNVPNSAIRTVDDGVTRNIKDRIQIQGLYEPGVGSSYGSAIRMLAEYDGETLVSMKNIVLSNFEIEQLLETHPDLGNSLSFGRAAHKGAFLPPSIGVMLHYLFRQRNRIQADDFFDKLANGENVSGPILTLRNRLIRMPKKVRQAAATRWELVALVVKTWNACRAGKDIQVLRFHKDEKFPVIV